MQRYAGPGTERKGVIIISVFDNILPLLAERYSLMPFFEMQWFLITKKEDNDAVLRIKRLKPQFIFVWHKVETKQFFDPWGVIFDKSVAQDERLSASGRLHELRNVFLAVESDYTPVAIGKLLTVYKLNWKDVLSKQGHWIVTAGSILKAGVTTMLMTSIFARYIAVGLLNTAVGYSFYAIFIFFGLHYSLAVLLSTILGVLFNFKTIGTIVFKNGSNQLLLRFIAVYAVTYILNIVGLRVFDHFKFDMYLAGALILIPLAIISFVLHKTFVFRTKGLA